MSYRLQLKAIFGCAEDGEEMAAVVLREDDDGRLRVEFWGPDGEMEVKGLVWIAPEDRPAFALFAAGAKPVEVAAIRGLDTALMKGGGE